MAEEDDVVLKLDLDDSAFQQALSSASETLNSFGNGESVQGLVDQFGNLKGTIGELAEGGSLGAITEAFTEFGALIGIAGAGVAAFAAGLHMTMEGEQVQAVSKEFDLLAKNAGIAGDVMKEKLLAATGGMISETEALQLANNAMLKLGTSSQQIPDLMELARKSALVMGTDVQTAFQNITMAVSSGNQRMLKRVGLMVDVKKAEEEYAQALGLTSDELSQQGKSQAIINAMLEKQQTTFAGIGSSMKPVTTSWQQLKTAVSEFVETIEVLFSKNFGGFFKTMLDGITSVVNFTKDSMNAMFGKPKDQLTALQNQLARLNTDQAYWTKELAKGSPAASDNLRLLDSQISAITKKIEALKPAVASVNAAEKKTEPSQAAVSDRVVADSKDNEAIKKNRAAFYKDLDALKKADAATDAKMVQTDEQLARSDAQTKAAIYAKLNSDKAQVAIKYKGHADEIRKMDTQLDKNAADQVAQFDEQATARRIKMLDNYAAHAKGTWQGFTRGAEVASKKATLDLQNTAKLGSSAFNDLSAGVGNAFQQMGAGAAGGSSNIEHAILGMLGKVAAQYGSVMMLASIWPFNPPVFAAGAALEVLAGALGAVGNTSSAASPAAAAASDPATALGATGASSSTTPSAASASSQKAQGVTIQVQGSVFDSPATGMRMVDLIRQASDQTGYNYVQIGNKPYGT